jgi:hypothetical protein
MYWKYYLESLPHEKIFKNWTYKLGCMNSIAVGVQTPLINRSNNFVKPAPFPTKRNCFLNALKKTRILYRSQINIIPLGKLQSQCQHCFISRQKCIQHLNRWSHRLYNNWHWLKALRKTTQRPWINCININILCQKDYLEFNMSSLSPHMQQCNVI